MTRTPDDISGRVIERLRHRVEHVDTDASGVVHFARYVSLLETVALAALGKVGLGMQRLEQYGLDLRVRRHAMRYHAAASYPDTFILEAGIASYGPARLCLSGRILRSTEQTEELLASGTLELAVVKRATRRPVALPRELLAHLDQHEEDGP